MDLFADSFWSDIYILLDPIVFGQASTLIHFRSTSQEGEALTDKPPSFMCLVQEGHMFSYLWFTLPWPYTFCIVHEGGWLRTMGVTGVGRTCSYKKPYSVGNLKPSTALRSVYVKHSGSFSLSLSLPKEVGIELSRHMGIPPITSQHSTCYIPCKYRLSHSKKECIYLYIFLLLRRPRCKESLHNPLSPSLMCDWIEGGDD